MKRPVVVKTSRPFSSVTTLGRPRISTLLASPASRRICTPVTRASASATLASGQLADVLRHDRVHDEVALLLDLLGGRGGRAHARDHLDLLGEAAELQHDVDGDRDAGLHLDPVARELLEALQLRLDPVEPFDQVGEDVRAVLAGHGRARGARPRVRGGDDRTGYGDALRIDHRPAQGGVGALGPCWRREERAESGHQERKRLHVHFEPPAGRLQRRENLRRDQGLSWVR